jgi:hypothetical protein
MQAAALSATKQVQLSIKSQTFADNFVTWLQNHGRIIQQLELGTACPDEYPMVDLPWEHLSGLQSLDLSGIAVPAFYSVPAVVSSIESQGVKQYVQVAHGPVEMLAPMPALAAGAASQPSATLTLGLLPDLTQLQLSSCRLRGCRDIPGWISAQLAPVTRLQHLELHGLDDGSTNTWDTWSGKTYLPAAACSGLQTTLDQLTQLTHLHLALNYHTYVPGSLAVLSGLRQLQWLSLMNVGSELHPVKLEDIPQSLTYLDFSSCTVSCSAKPGGDFQLDALQQLSLCKSDFTGASPPAWAYAPNLRQVYACATYNTHSADAFAALTASSNLTSLELVRCSFPVGAVECMFTASRQLPWLPKLAINKEPEVTARIGEGAPLVLSHGDLANLTACSPNLRELSLIWADDEMISCSELKLLQRLTALTKLSVGGPAWDDATVEAVLAGMTGEALTYTCPMLCI